MLGLAVFGPIGIAAAVIGTVATAVYASSSDSSSSSSDKDTKVSDAKKEVTEEKNEKILKDINTYKDKEKLRMKKKYNADIEVADNFTLAVGKETAFMVSPLWYTLSDKSDDKKVKVVIVKSSADDLSNVIVALEEETQEIKNLLEELEMLKHASIN